MTDARQPPDPLAGEVTGNPGCCPANDQPANGAAADLAATVREQLRHLGPFRGGAGEEALDALLLSRDEALRDWQMYQHEVGDMLARAEAAEAEVARLRECVQVLEDDHESENRELQLLNRTEAAENELAEATALSHEHYEAYVSEVAERQKAEARAEKLEAEIERLTLPNIARDQLPMLFTQMKARAEEAEERVQRNFEHFNYIASVAEEDARVLAARNEQLETALTDAVTWIENFPLNDSPDYHDHWRSLRDRIRAALAAGKEPTA